VTQLDGVPYCQHSSWSSTARNQRPMYLAGGTGRLGDLQPDGVFAGQRLARQRALIRMMQAVCVRHAEMAV
jgi:hypothetical protein